MTHLHELLDDLAADPGPASQLHADDLFTAGRRLHRRRTAGLVATGVALVVMAGTGAAVAMDNNGAGELPADERTATAVPTTRPSGIAPWAGAADAQHLYLMTQTCRSAPCVKTVVQVSGSSDGGRTWTGRGSPLNLAEPRVIDRETLIARVPGEARQLIVSVDGARTWSPVETAGTTVPALPAGDALVCWPGGVTEHTTEDSQSESRCGLYAVDADAARAWPLAVQPPIVIEPAGLDSEGSLLAVDNRLWVAGTDPDTGRPAVATSQNAGRTWTSHTFAEAPACTPESCGWPRLASNDGTTGYAVIADPAGRRLLVYRGTIAGKWQPQPGKAPPYQEEAGLAGCYLTGDGAHVIVQNLRAARETDAVGTVGFWVARSADEDYLRVRLVGLPETVRQIRRTPDGRYFTLSYYPDSILYGSGDGWRWSPLPR